MIHTAGAPDNVFTVCNVAQTMTRRPRAVRDLNRWLAW
jgi:hypothetical protein